MPSRALAPQKVLFLDRDGVINVNHGYVHKAEDCEFIDGIFELCRKAKQKGYLIVIVTNQSGIARGYYSENTFLAFSRWLENAFWRKGIKIAHTFYCPHHPKVSDLVDSDCDKRHEKKYGRKCTCRKPGTGMLFKAKHYYGLDFSRSLMVGDSLSDIACARKAGVKKSVLFRSDSIQYGSMFNGPRLNKPRLMRPGKKPYFRVSSLKAIQQLL